MTRYCEVCGDELPNPFTEGAFLTIESVDIGVRIRQPDRPHNHEVINKVDVCSRECVEEYKVDHRDRMIRHYSQKIDYRDE